jgi:H+/Cl- antiporter ClcA
MIKKVIVLIYSMLLAAIIGVVAWGFLCLSKIVVDVLWHTHFHFEFLYILIPIIFGVMIGYFEKYNGIYPRNPDLIVDDYLKGDRRDVDNPIKTLVGSLLPIMGGGSVGPESSIISIVVPMSVRFGDRTKALASKFNLNVEPNRIPSDLKMLEKIKYSPFKSIRIFLMNLTGLIVLAYLSKIDNFEELFTSVGTLEITRLEILFIIPLVLVGMIVAYLYFSFGVISKKISSLFGENIIVRSTLVGLLLGVTYYFVPISLFSGEHNLKVLSEQYLEYMPVLLVILGIWKLFLTQICLKNGWRGGHGFPIIFSGVAIGYGLSMLFGINPVVAISIITSVSMGIVYSPFLAVVVMLLVLVPTNIGVGILFITIVSAKLYNKKSIN